MQIGCHGSVWTCTFDTAGLDLAISQTRQAGFDLIEIPLMDPDDIDGPAVRKLLQRHELAATASLGLGAGNDLSSEDAEVSAAGERLGIEVVNRYESNLVNTSRQGVEYVEQVGDDQVYVHLDTYHMNIEEPDMFTPVLTAGPKLGYVHIGESHRGYLGSGTVDFDSFFRALAHIGYDGPIVFESFSSAVVHKDLSTMLGIWRNLWSDGLDLGRHANNFIRGQLKSVASIGMQ
jgi:D-psicose/D-tagatose/L-ribulose 3-epimerase